MTAPANATTNPQDLADGGVGQAIINLLTLTCNWNIDQIHIEEIPQKWIDFATTINSDLRNMGQATGDSNLNQAITNPSGVSSIAPAQLNVPGSPVGTNLPSNLITATWSTTNDFLNLVTPGRGQALPGNESIPSAYFDVNPQAVENIEYWCAIKLPINSSVSEYYIPSTTTQISPSGQPITSSFSGNFQNQYNQVIQFLQGSGAQTYPTVNNSQGKKTTYNQGRLIQVKSPTTGAVIWVHCVAMLPPNWVDPVSGNNQVDVVFSDSAWKALGFTATPVGTNSSSQSSPFQKLSIDGWVNPNNQTLSLTGRVITQSTTTSIPVASSTPTKTTSKQSSKYAAIPGLSQ
jgi:hypothetical protein